MAKAAEMRTTAEPRWTKWIWYGPRLSVRNCCWYYALCCNF